MKIQSINLPDYSYSFSDYPVVTKEEVNERYERLLEKILERGLTHLIIYGDREHHANLLYLTGGYDSRFEETLLVVQLNEPPVLILGNEGMSYADTSLLDHRKELFQTFSLQGMTRDRKRFLSSIFKDCGIDGTSKVGVVGLKYYENGEVRDPLHTFDVPHYIIEELSETTIPENLVNAADVMTHPTEGLRSVLTPRDMARSEFMNNYLSNQMARIIDGLEPGISESEAMSLFDYRGIPFVIHPVVNFGRDRVLLGLASPSFSRRLEPGDPVSVGFCVPGASIARTGFAVQSEKDFHGPLKDIIEAFYFPYFRGLKAWYESISIGADSGTVYDAVTAILGGGSFGVSLNPGHQTHLEEWINSPFREDFHHTLRSGMAFQCDIIAFPGGPYVGVHVEDTVVIADESTRTRLKQEYPEAFMRIMLRGKTMRDILGIDIGEHVLPLSNLQAVLQPFLLNPAYAVVDG